MFTLPANKSEIVTQIHVDTRARVHFFTTGWTGMEAEFGDNLSAEVNYVLWRSFKFQQFVIAGGFKTSSFKLISNL